MTKAQEDLKALVQTARELESAKAAFIEELAARLFGYVCEALDEQDVGPTVYAIIEEMRTLNSRRRRAAP